LIEREQLSVYTMDMIHLKGIGFVAEDIKRKLKVQAPGPDQEDILRVHLIAGRIDID